MLASLLPGVRDLRTPLAVGYVLLLSLWLLLAEAVPSRTEATGALARVYELGAAVGVPVLLSTASFVAYLVGSVLVVTAPPPWVPWRLLASRESREQQRRLRRLAGQLAEGLPSVAAVTTPAAERLERLLDEPVDASRRLPLWSRGGGDAHEPAAAPAIARHLHADLSTTGTRLLVANKDLWDGYDRLRAEGELRLSLLLPLLALSGVLGARVSPWAVLLAGLPLVLASQGLGRFVSAECVLAEAVLQGQVRTGFQDRLAEAVQAVRAKQDGPATPTADTRPDLRTAGPGPGRRRRTAASGR